TADYDNDGFVDLAVSTKDQVLLFHNEKSGTFKDVTRTAGIRSAGKGLTFVDYDHDGDADLYITEPCVSAVDGLSYGMNSMWRNNGNGTFTDVTVDTGLGGLTPVISALGTDFDNDRAVDLLLTAATPVLFKNPREGKFIAEQFWASQGPAGPQGTVVLDFD